MSAISNDPRHRLALASMILSVAMMAFLPYRDIFGYFFTASDALTQIDSSRIASLKDIFRILSEPMGNHTKLLNLVHHYRPTAIFSYSIDYALWGLNPFGYHLTDVMLHVLVSVLTFLMIRRLTASSVVAWLGAVLFAIHPVHAENVPAIARRHDAIAMLFMYVSMFLFLKNYSKAARSSFMSALSLVAFAVALGAKEIAPIFPVMLLGYVGIDTWPAGRTAATPREWFGKALRPVLPYLALTVLYVGWRTWVLKGFGGDQWEARLTQPEIVAMYVKGLLDPYGFIASHSSAIVRVLCWALVASWIFWRFLWHATGRRSAEGRALAFFALWLLLPLGIFMVTQSFALRRIYVGVIPMCAIVALVLVDAYNGARRSLAPVRTRGARAAAATAGHGLTLAVTAMVCAGFVFYSPLFRNFSDWHYNSVFTRLFLQRLSELVPQLPADARLHIHDLPFKFVKPTRTEPHVETTAGLLDYSIESWIDMVHPENHMRVVLHKRPSLEIPPTDIDLVAQTSEDRIVKIYVEYEFTPGADTSNNDRDMGKAHIDVGDFEAAVQYLDAYVRSAPNDHLGWAFLGEARLSLGSVAAAESALRHSLDLKSRDNDTAYLNLARVLRATGRYAGAIDLCQEWAKNSPGAAAPAYRNIGWVFLSQREYERAAGFFEKSLAIEKSVHSYRGLLMAWVDGLGDYERGKVYAREWTDFARRDAEGQCMLGYSYYKNNEPEAAAVHLERSIELGRQGDEAPYRAFQALGAVKLQIGDVAGGIEVLKDGALAYPDSAGIRADVAEACVRLGRCHEAREWLAQAVEAGLEPTREAKVKGAVGRCESTRDSRKNP